MNRTEARTIVLQELDKYRVQTHQQLTRLFTEHDDYEVVAASGVKYQIEIGAFYDDKKDKSIRVMGSIDDGSGISSFLPLTESFIILPNGSFLNE